MIGFLWAFIGAVFGAGCAWTALKLGLAKEREDRENGDKAERERREQEVALIRKDLNGLGAKMRQDEGRAERRWKHSIATQVETSATVKEAREHAKLLREDAWRD